MPPQRQSQQTQLIILGLIVLAVILIAVIGLWLNTRHRKRDWTDGPVAPGVYVPSTEPTATTSSSPPTTVPPPTAATPLNVQMFLGNPSDATTDASSRDNYLMLKPYFALSYNASKGTPNWVSWRVQASDLGSAPRARVFATDTTLPDGFYRVTQHDYSLTGFDRGHMCPHGDRAADDEMSFSTFICTNIVPQAPNNNRKCWEQLESYCRGLVQARHMRLYITCGPSGRGGAGDNGPAETIAGAKVNVPAETWKVIVASPDTGRDDINSISAGDRVIAVDVPNDNSTGEEWAGFRCTPAAIEAETGYHFFTALPAETRAAFDAKLDTQRIVQPPNHGGG